MDQIQYEIIMKVLKYGAGCMSEELCTCVKNLIDAYNNVATQHEELRAQYDKLQSKYEVLLEMQNKNDDGICSTDDVAVE